MQTLVGNDQRHLYAHAVIRNGPQEITRHTTGPTSGKLSTPYALQASLSLITVHPLELRPREI